jgi:hypothetical protein
MDEVFPLGLVGLKHIFRVQAAHEADIRAVLQCGGGIEDADGANGGRGGVYILYFKE